MAFSVGLKVQLGERDMPHRGDTLKVEPENLRNPNLEIPQGLEANGVESLYLAASDFLKNAVEHQAINAKDANEWGARITEQETYSGLMERLLHMVHSMPITQVAASHDFF
ncbi:MAG: hypothetical protein KDD70_06955, partial [Bdellovibrionales bacterium]|nr:hypothetical protein [Bdellovibrionales bacterium]